MSNNTKLEKQTISLWDTFDETMTENDYHISVKTPELWDEERSIFGKPMSSLGTTAYSDDVYAPIIKLYVAPQYDSMSITIQDRCGNKILDGKDIAYIKLKSLTGEKMNEALNFVKDNFLIYNENNTVPTKFEKIKREF